MSKPVYYDNMLQGTDEWIAVRCGKLTASTIGQLFTAKGAPSFAAGTKTIALEKAAERITQHVEPIFYSSAMARGHRDEEIARDLYSKQRTQVTETGFVTLEVSNDEGRAMLGYSPDGLVGNDGLIEIKSRSQKWQMQTIVRDEIPAEYFMQIQTGLLVTGREWCDFISFCGGMAMYVRRVLPCHDTHRALIDRAIAFENEVQEYMKDYYTIAGDAFVPPRVEDETEMFV